MPRITRLFIRSGMVFFLMALATAVLLELSRAEFIETALTGLTPVFWHFLLVGWITQIIMGVSIWMFPRKHRGHVKESEGLAYFSFYTINVGLILRAAAEPISTGLYDGEWVEWGLVISAVLQVAGGLAYVAVIWSRVRGKSKRKKRGG